MMTEMVASSAVVLQFSEGAVSPVDQRAWLNAGWPQEQLESMASMVADAMLTSLVPLVSI